MYMHLYPSLLLSCCAVVALLGTPSQSAPAPPDAVAGAPLPYDRGQLPVDCPIKYSLQVRISEDDAGGLSGRTVTIHLIESSTDFLHSSERTRGGGGVVGSDGRQFQAAPLPPCFYQGFVEGDDGLAFAKQRNGMISGNFHFSNRVYEIPEQPAPAASDSDSGPSAAPPPSPPPLTARPHPPLSGSRTCGVRPDTTPEPMPAADRREEIHRRSRRSLMLDTRSNYSDLSRKYIQLILVGDQYYYSNQSSSMSQAQNRLWEIGNYVNALYKQLGVNVITVYTETWTSDPYTLTSIVNPDGVNSTELLIQFLNYRMRRLSVKTHSAAHLVSGLKFAGRGDVGLASMAKLCSFSQAGGVNSDRDANVYSIAVTVAHELGHNIGLNHDEDERAANCGTCPDPQGCVMAKVGSDVNPVRFTNCSVFRFLDFTTANGIGYCMSDPPPDSATVGAKATCGNRIVEAGEDCDCGPARWCNNPCCNPNTCKFTAGAACASGDCCNINTCTLMAQGTVCRAERSTCDLPEYCNGTSEWCPQFDDYKVDGTVCLTGKAYCYKGRCNDRDSRCAAIFNGTGFSAGPPEWAVGTTQGNAKGYCSYNEASLSPLTYTYTACTTANQRCGLLYCQGGTLATAEPMPKWKGMSSSDTNVFDATIGGVRIDSAGYAMHNLKYSGYRDPGLVPNGAECGTNLMCVDSVCVSTTSSVTCPNCNGRGSCAQSGLCFCQPGYRPPDCVQTGSGGSLTNPMPDSTTGPNRRSAVPAEARGSYISVFSSMLGCLLVTFVLK